MSTDQERINVALDTLVQICAMTPSEIGENRIYEKREAANEILRHYREGEFLRNIRENGITVNINGALPVRPMTRSEMEK